MDFGNAFGNRVAVSSRVSVNSRSGEAGNARHGLQTLQAMGIGGIHERLKNGAGFHRE